MGVNMDPEQHWCMKNTLAEICDDKESKSQPTCGNVYLIYFVCILFQLFDKF